MGTTMVMDIMVTERNMLTEKSMAMKDTVMGKSLRMDQNMAKGTKDTVTGRILRMGENTAMNTEHTATERSLLKEKKRVKTINKAAQTMKRKKRNKKVTLTGNRTPGRMIIMKAKIRKMKKTKITVLPNSKKKTRDSSSN